jgi:hypothetical protein
VSARVDAYRSALHDIFERDLSGHDGTSAALLANCERRIGRRLPPAVREFYLLAGEASETREHNHLIEAGDLSIEDGYLVFMHENQDVVSWGVRVPFDADDPEVWQCVNGDWPEWHSEEIPFSDFIVRNLAWQHGADPPEEQ